MDAIEYAARVNAARAEIKEMKRGSVAEPRQGESQSAYMQRMGGGDAASARAAGRWDRRRARMPKRRRMMTPRYGGGSSASGVNDWYGYSGWANEFNHSTPAVHGRRVRK